jgi:hypothetical protein
LLFSQLLTLYITPVVYTYMDQFHRWVSGDQRKPPSLEVSPARLAEPRERRAAIS